MKRLMIAVFLVCCGLATADRESTSNSDTSAVADTHEEIARPVLSEAEAERERIVAAFREEVAGKGDENGCLWREADNKRAKQDEGFAALRKKICRAEKLALELANADRARYCPGNPLILDQRLAYVSRLNAIRQAETGGGMFGDAHSAWYQRKVQGWFTSLFPAAAKVIGFERENFWGMGGGGARGQSAEALAKQMVTEWIGSPGHHAPMMDCSNRYAGVGLHFDESRGEWLAYMSFGELILK